METLDSIDLQTWRDACKANGLPTSGTKLELYHRLQSGSGDARKKGKGKMADVSEDRKGTTPPSPGFVAKEYAALKGAGFDDEDEIQRVIEMRWQ
eukprot:2176923-Prymnesium_polylepis.1